MNTDKSQRLWLLSRSCCQLFELNDCEQSIPRLTQKATIDRTNKRVVLGSEIIKDTQLIMSGKESEDRRQQNERIFSFVVNTCRKSSKKGYGYLSRPVSVTHIPEILKSCCRDYTKHPRF